MIEIFESFDLSCRFNDNIEEYRYCDQEYLDDLDNSRIYLILITKKSIDRIRGHSSSGMKDTLAQEFQYILKRKGKSYMIPVIMDISSKNTMRW